MSANRRVLWALSLSLSSCAAPAPRGPSVSKEAVILLVARLDPNVPDPGAASAVVQALGRAGRSEAVEPLMSLWETLLARKFRLLSLPPELEVLRGDLAEALGRLGDIKAVPALRRGLIDDDQRLAALSAEALAALGDAASLPTLVRLAEGPDSGAAQSAFEALGALGGAEAEAGLRRGLETTDPLRRAAAAYGLARMGRVAGTLHLDGFLEESDVQTRERVLAAYYLARLGRQNGWAALASAAADTHAATRTAAALFYGRLSGDRALAGLKALAADADPGVREAAQRGLSSPGLK